MEKKSLKRLGEWLVFFAAVSLTFWFAFDKVLVWRTEQVMEMPTEGFMFWACTSIALFVIINMLFQAILTCFYKPVTEWRSDAEFPGCTVIVPAYNEGSAVADTLRSLLKSDFPKDKLEIIAINDGSKDDTWNWISLVAGESNGLIKAVNLEQNQGKKNALHYGFNHAKFDLVVTIDSDSLVEKDTLSNLLLPFARPEVGGVAGTVRVSNVKDGFVPKMLDFWFVFSCGFLRCAQSTLGSVLCSPGAISAYRKEALLPHLDKWLHQTFLGQPSHIGEDRALTSILLRNNYHVVLQSEAGVITKVPTDYPQLCRTLLRWNRGDVREGLLLIKHFFTRVPESPRTVLLTYIIFAQLLGLMLPLLALPLFLSTLGAEFNLNIMIINSVIVSLLWAIVPALIYAEKESPLKAMIAFAVGVVSIFALSWICVYSWFTVRNSKWMTRDVKKDQDAVQPEIRRIS